MLLFSGLAVAVLTFAVWRLNSTTLTQTQFFTIALPKNWQILELPQTDGDSKLRSFDVLSPDSQTAFTVTVATDGPRIISCFCGLPNGLVKTVRDGIEYYDGRLDERHRCLKAIGERFGTDVHLSYGDYDKQFLDEIAESVRPL